MTTKEPMDPERLAGIREGVEWRRERPQPGDDDRDTIIAELLRDRDYQEKRAAERQLALELIAEEVGGLPDAYTALVARVAEQSVDVGKWKGRAEGLAAHNDALQAEVTRLRSRVRVEASDVEAAIAAGLTEAHLHAWAAAHGRNDYMFRGALRWPVEVAAIVHGWSLALRRPGLDILDEMAAMPTEPQP